MDGARACPPEDCGGIWGYVEFLEAIFDPHHPEHLEKRDWVSDEFNPEEFSVDKVNRELKNRR